MNSDRQAPRTARVDEAILALADGRGGALSFADTDFAVGGAAETVALLADRAGMRVVRSTHAPGSALVAGGTLLGAVNALVAPALEVVPRWHHTDYVRRWFVQALADRLGALAENEPLVVVTEDSASSDDVAHDALTALLARHPAPLLLWVDVVTPARPVGPAAAAPSSPVGADTCAVVELLCALLPTAPTTDDLAALCGTGLDAMDAILDSLAAAGRLVRFEGRGVPSGDGLRPDVLGSFPEAISVGLLRAALVVLAARGVPASALAESAMSLDDPADEAVRAILLDAMTEARVLSPDDAARFGLRAAAMVTAGNDELLVATAWELLPLLWQTSRSEEAADLASRVFTEHGRGDVEAQVKLWLARLEPFSDRALQMTTEALALSGVSALVRSQLLAVRVRLFSTLGRIDHVAEELPAALELATSQNDHDSLSRLHASVSIRGYYLGEYGVAREWAESSRGHFARSGLEVAQWMPELMWHPYLTHILGDPASALQRCDEMMTEILAKNQLSALRFLHALRASVLLSLGRLGESADEATAAEVVEQNSAGFTLGVNDRLQAMPFGVRLAVAVQRGDARTLHAFEEVLAGNPLRTQLESTRRTAAWRLLIADATATTPADESALVAVLRGAPEGAPMPVAWIDPADDVTFVEMCLRRGYTDLAERCVVYARERAARNPDEPLATAIAAHLDGVLLGSAAAFERAVEEWTRLRRPVLAGAAREGLGWLHAAEGRPDAHAGLLAAHDAYLATGATRLANLVRKRMRDAGWQVRLMGAGGDESDPLTPMERNVVEQAVLGSTTARIADEIFVSRHTVVAHLRHVYTKLGISSRRELTEWFALESGAGGATGA